MNQDQINFTRERLRDVRKHATLALAQFDDQAAKEARPADLENVVATGGGSPGEFVNDPESYLILGKDDTAEPGAIATIEVLVQTPHPIGGIGLTFGVDPHLVLSSHQVSIMLQRRIAQERFGMDVEATEWVSEFQKRFRPMRMVSQGRTGNNPSAHFVAVFLGFFSQLQEGDSLAGKTGPFELAFPEMTPLLSLSFRVPANAPPGKTYHLDNTSFRYGREMRNAQGRTIILRQKTVLTTPHDDEEFPHGIYPQLQDGWIRLPKPLAD